MFASSSLRQTVAMVALANLLYFFVEVGVAERIGSVALFADSIDFLEDTAVNFLIIVALGWSVRKRTLVGMFMAVLLLVPTAALLWTAWQKFHAPLPPDPALLSLTGAGAMIVNIGCALLLARFRHHSGSLTKAAFLSARNDAIANVAIIAAGAVTLFWPSGWPDLLVGIGIAIMNIDAAIEVWEAAHEERMGAEA